MRKIWVILMILLGLLVASPYLMGLWAKKEVKRLVAVTPLPPGLYLEVQDYQLGYISSTFTLYVKMLDPAMAFEPAEIPKHEVEFLSQARIQHGPLLMTNRGLCMGLAYLHGTLAIDDLIMLTSETKQGLRSYFEDSELISIDATLGLTGSWEGTFDSTRVNFDDPQGKVQWGGISGELQYFGGLRTPENKIGIKISPLLLQSKSEHPAIVDSAQIKIFSNTLMTEEGLWVGSQFVEIPAFYLKDEQSNEIRFDHFKAMSKSNIEQNLAQVQLKAGADNIIFFTQRINTIDFNVSIDKLDAKSLVEFGSVANTSSNSMTNKERQALTFALIGMLSPGAELNLNHLMKLDEGDVVAKLKMVFPDLSKERTQQPPETIAQQLIMKLDALLSLTMPMHWLEDSLYRIALARLPENAPPHKDPKTGVVIPAKDALRNDINDQLKILSEQRILINNGTTYTFLLGYKDGVISLNGTVLSQEDIQKLLSVFQPQANSVAK